MKTQWNLGTATIGGTEQRGGWLCVFYLSLWLRQWTLGVSYHNNDFEDGDPKVVLHLGPAVLWCRFQEILPGYRAKRRARLTTSRS